MKILLAYDIVYDYLTNKDKNSEVHLLIDLLQKMSVSVYIDSYTYLLLYYEGKISSLNSSVIKGTFKLPLMQRYEYEVTDKSELIVYLRSIDYESLYYLDKDSELNTTLKLFFYCNRLSAINDLRRDKVDIIISNEYLFYSYCYLKGVHHRVFTIEQFFERLSLDFPKFTLRLPTGIEECYFGDIDVKDSFFNSFRVEYKEFNEWFQKKSEEKRRAYTVRLEGTLKAFLALKVEDVEEIDLSISPIMPPKKRLKICSFKVAINGFRISERFLNIIFKKALEEKVDEIYITVFDRYENRIRLIQLLKERWGFENWGKKKGEIVLFRPLKKKEYDNPRSSYPCHYIPESTIIISLNSSEIAKNDNGYLRQMFIGTDVNPRIQKGSVILFWNRTKKKYEYSAVVEDVIRNFSSKEDFISGCKKRSNKLKNELSRLWNKGSGNITVVKYLRNYDFSDDDSQKMISNYPDVVKPFKEIELVESQFNELIRNTLYEKDIIINKA